MASVRLTLIAAISMVAITQTASAADLGRRINQLQAPAPGPASPVYSWTGFYMGGNFGYGWSHRDFTNTITGTAGGTGLTASNSSTDDSHGWLGGGQVGFNYQFLGNWVAGLEADIDAADMSSSTSACFTGFGTGVCGTRETNLKNFGTVRGRLGYAFNNVLVYGTGGWAWSHLTNTIQFTCIGPACPGTSGVPPTSPAPATVDINASGWAAGGGLEWAFLPNWTLRAEYLHLQFDGLTEDRSKSSTFVPGLLVTSHVSSNVHTDMVRVGVNYMFGWAPQAARY